ncbi:MAG: hypothetical protein FWF22_06685 [Treponema sp.]|nr:hypothetical protein [Treponema sp.]
MTKYLSGRASLKFQLFGKCLFGILTIFLAVLFFGCATTASAPVSAPAAPPPPQTIIVQTPPDTLMPLTVGILQRLFESNEQMVNEIKNYQMILFGRIYLERNYTQSSNSLNSGKVTFEDLHVREDITVPDQTEGQTMQIDITNNEIVLSVCFEREDRYSDCLLQFTSSLNDPEGYFYLKYSPNGKAATAADDRGVLQYGGPEYRLKFSGDKSPYLMIMLTQRDTDRVNSRTASGRKIQ